ncbi:Pectinesterase/pectinesterase inhibitor U1 [Acorus calamus]|uniref:Pectinesterase/pectinesterase inhibitor U1 n=1 Tax=Acorus calamus TaxID=4465 RepID=A0AAV9E740_ACOCL|nr:Pectinesterase/pectinesterase inhibitor U1 [Acorus calamus]
MLDPRLLTHEALIKTICSETHHVDLCLSTLKSDPLSFTTDCLGLTKITINATTKTSDDITNYVKRLYCDAKAGRTKSAIADCVELYKDVKDQFGNAVKDLNAGDDAGANANVSAALTDGETCKDGFDEAGAGLPGGLQTLGVHFLDLCSVVLSMINHLK